VSKWTVILSPARPDVQEVKLVVEADSEQGAKSAAWAQAEGQGATTATHYVSKCVKRRGDGFSGGFGRQKQEIEGGTPPVTPEPKVTPVPTVPGSLDAMVAAIATAAAASVKQDVNPDSIRAIVKAEVEQGLKALPPRVIQVQDLPPVKLDGVAHPALEQVLKMVATPKPDGTRVNVMLVGPAGAGKTYLAHQVAKVLGLPYATTSLTAGTTEGELVGRLFPTMQGHEYLPSAFGTMYEQGGTFLADEVDAADSNVLLRLNQATANGALPLADGRLVARHPKSIILAAANTWGHGANREYVGRNALDGAFLDRWVAIPLDYDAAVEEAVVLGHNPNGMPLLNEWRRIRAAARSAKLPKPVSMRKVADLAFLLHVGAFKNVKEAVSNALAGWSEAERKAVGA
jgi:cobaltochelatase CobS